MAKWNTPAWQLEDELSLDKYQQEALSTAIYPQNKALEYLALKLCGESGEVAEKIGKSIRDNKPLDDKELAK